MVPRRRRADVGRARVPGPATATTRRRSSPPRSSGSACPASGSATGPAARSIGNATCFPVSMARGATWDPDLEERVGDAIGRELRAVGANLTGAVCVNVLRHPAWGRAQETYGEDPHHVGELGAALTRGLQRHVHGVREALRLQLDGERPLHRRHRGRRRRPPRGVPPALPPDRRRGRRVGDVGLQQRQRRVVRARTASCSPTSCATSGASRGSSSATGSSGCATPATSVTAGLDIEMPYRMVRAAAPPRRPRARRGVVGRRRPRRRARSSPRCCASTTSSPRPPRPPTCSARPSTARSPARSRPAPSSCSATSPSTARPVLPARRRRPRAWRCSAGSPTPSTSATAGRATCGTSTATPSLDGLRAAVDDVVHDDGTDLDARRRGRRRRRRRRRGRRLHLPRRGRVHRRRPTRRSPTSSRAPTSPRSSSGSRRGSPRLPPTTKPPRLADRPGGLRRRRRPQLAAPARRTTSSSSGPSPPPTPGPSSPSRPAARSSCTEWIDAVPAVVQAWYGGCQAGPGLADVLLGDGQPVGPAALQRARRRGRPARRSTATPTHVPSTTAGTAGGTSPAPAPRRRSRSGSASRTRPSPLGDVDVVGRRRRA